MSVYLISAPVLPDFGEYSYILVSTEEARAILSKGFISVVWYQWAADYLRDILGVNVRINRGNVRLEVGDTAAVFQMKKDFPEGVFTKDDIEKGSYCFGLLKKNA